MRFADLCWILRSIVFVHSYESKFISKPNGVHVHASFKFTIMCWFILAFGDFVTFTLNCVAYRCSWSVLSVPRECDEMYGSNRSMHTRVLGYCEYFKDFYLQPIVVLIASSHETKWAPSRTLRVSTFLHYDLGFLFLGETTGYSKPWSVGLVLFSVVGKWCIGSAWQVQYGPCRHNAPFLDQTAVITVLRGSSLFPFQLTPFFSQMQPFGRNPLLLLGFAFQLSNLHDHSLQSGIYALQFCLILI
jgi:hypothetical protein